MILKNQIQRGDDEVLTYFEKLPFYGFVLSYAKLKDSWWLTVGAGIICLHLVGIAV